MLNQGVATWRTDPVSLQHTMSATTPHTILLGADGTQEGIEIGGWKIKTCWNSAILKADELEEYDCFRARLFR